MRAWLVSDPLEYGWSRTLENSGGESLPARGSCAHRWSVSCSSSSSKSLIAVGDVLHKVVGVGEKSADDAFGLALVNPPVERPDLVLDDLVAVTNRQPGLLRCENEPEFG